MWRARPTTVEYPREALWSAARYRRFSSRQVYLHWRMNKKLKIPWPVEMSANPISGHLSVSSCFVSIFLYGLRL
jgi:hypothetical protein